MSGAYAIIPARGGSRRVPRKNVRPFHGRPMIAWVIDAARESACFDRVIVSTEDDEIAEAALRAGAEVPFRRPARLADDFTSTRAVIQHAIGTLADAGESPELICCVYPFAAFVRASDLRGARDVLVKSGGDFVFSAAEYRHPIQRAFREEEGGGLAFLWPEHAKTRTQDLAPRYHDAGQFYWGRREAFAEGRPSVSACSRMWVLPPERVHDIDTPADWEHAELVFEAIRKRGG